MSAEADGLITTHADGCPRCGWPGLDPTYVTYHDTEWGVPEYESRALYEKLILDGFQAGLSWITILRRREGFRRAFEGFAPERVARFTEADVERLMADTGIVRNRAKIRGAIAGARGWLAIEEAGPGFSDFLWDFCDGRPIQTKARRRSQIATETELSRKISKALKKKGFTFVGPTIVHAFMQAVGMVNDHLVGCHRHAPCAALGEAPRP
ncbi:DNA-3-methyladenine glycosylase I [Methylobacterium sp. Leaf118]|uniref:DNA-3-methyladenine glycosylase I n=1 Tax=Methylobacterium sp. Leaf118 TaxID=2876562 RepID=UPI001E33277B|nr:DNA-3-methyladenine glycosylase I [Methylobacterium sp. Leaf118]